VKRLLEVLPSTPAGALARRPAKDLPFPLLEPSSRLYSLGRHALAQGVRALGLGEGDELLVPAYHCGSEVEALERSGVVCRFFEADAMLRPEESVLEALVGPKTRGLYLIHYLGFPQDSGRWRRWCDERGLLLVEDAAPAWLATSGGAPTGAEADLSIFCLYKTFGLPDGATLFLRGRHSSAGEELPRQRAVAQARRHVGWAVIHSRVLTSAYARLGRNRTYDADADFALDDPVRPTASTLFLLPRLVDEGAPAARRANFEALRESLGDLLPEPFREVPPGASPFAFPVEIEAKAPLLARLAQEGIRAVDFWSEPHRSLPVEEFPAAAHLRGTTVGLPVHQELTPGELERISGAVLGPRRRQRPSLRVEPLHGFDGLQDEWNALAKRSGNLFATWDWASTWWLHFGEGSRLRLHACRDAGGDLVGLLPLCSRKAGPVRLLRFLGHGPGDELGPVCAPADRAAVARAFRGVLERGGWDVLLAEELPAPAGWSTLLGGHVLRREGSPLVDLERAGSWDAFLGTLSAKTRKNVRYHERRLEREHGLRYRMTETGDELQRDLDTLFRLHHGRWPEGGSVFAGRAEPFHRDFAARALERGWLRLWFLEVDGEAVAVSHNFRFAGAEFDYQGGRDPEWERYSVGFVLLTALIRSAFEDGLREYRLLRGGEHWKYHFASGDPELETFGVGRGPVGELALASGRAGLSLRKLRRASARRAGRP
jgi:CelD/BcsL family acetyltransferase involved in cellulose biosynthesis